MVGRLPFTIKLVQSPVVAARLDTENRCPGIRGDAGLKARTIHHGGDDGRRRRYGEQHIVDVLRTAVSRHTAKRPGGKRDVVEGRARVGRNVEAALGETIGHVDGGGIAGVGPNPPAMRCEQCILERRPGSAAIGGFHDEAPQPRDVRRGVNRAFRGSQAHRTHVVARNAEAGEGGSSVRTLEQTTQASIGKRAGGSIERVVRGVVDHVRGFSGSTWMLRMLFC